MHRLINDARGFFDLSILCNSFFFTIQIHECVGIKTISKHHPDIPKKNNQR